MILHKASDYRIMPWANGRGQTLELMRDDSTVGLRRRLSIATVVEETPFSIFPGFDRVLTVISGPGFDLVGSGLTLHAPPLTPVHFRGDIAISAVNVIGPSEDFNVMTGRWLPAPKVWMASSGNITPIGRLFLLPLAPSQVNGQSIAARDLVESREAVTIITDGPLIAVDFPDSHRQKTTRPLG
jgi:uncharacterized protein